MNYNSWRLNPMQLTRSSGAIQNQGSRSNTPLLNYERYSHFFLLSSTILRGSLHEKLPVMIGDVAHVLRENCTIVMLYSLFLYLLSHTVSAVSAQVKNKVLAKCYVSYDVWSRTMKECKASTLRESWRSDWLGPLHTAALGVPKCEKTVTNILNACYYLEVFDQYFRSDQSWSAFCPSGLQGVKTHT